jgi:hypothetical protein
MKSNLKITLTMVAGVMVAGVILAGIIISFWHRGPHLPSAQTPQAAGTFISENQLVFAGYKTPEAALESAFWALVTGDLDAFIASVPPNEQAETKKENPSSKRFKSEAKTGEFSGLKGVEIMARKNVSADKVELKFEMIDKNETNLVIFPAVKIGEEWKFNLKAGHDYATNWDNSGEVVTFAN